MSALSPISSLGEYAPGARKMQEMLTAITRAVSPSMEGRELTHLERQPIDIARAREQHRAYEVPGGTGCRGDFAPAEADYPTRCSWRTRRWCWTKSQDDADGRGIAARGGGIAGARIEAVPAATPAARAGDTGRRRRDAGGEDAVRGCDGAGATRLASGQLAAVVEPSDTTCGRWWCRVPALETACSYIGDVVLRHRPWVTRRRSPACGWWMCRRSAGRTCCRSARRVLVPGRLRDSGIIDELGRQVSPR